jgi:DNA-binding NtrC family response regulator
MMLKYTIYIIDDEASIRDAISMALEDDYRIETFSKAEHVRH